MKILLEKNELRSLIYLHRYHIYDAILRSGDAVAHDKYRTMQVAKLSQGLSSSASTDLDHGTKECLDLFQSCGVFFIARMLNSTIMSR